MATITDSYLVGQDYELSTTTRLGFTHPGYTFNGWNCSEGDTHEEGAVVKFQTKQTQITATWTPIEYSIAYELSGGTNNPGNPSKYTIESDDIVFLDPTKSGATFDKWVNEDGETVTGIVSGSMGDVNVIAQWVKSRGTIFTLSDDTQVEMFPDETGTAICITTASTTKVLKSQYAERFGSSSTSIVKSVDLAPEITSIAEGGFGRCYQLTSLSGENVDNIQNYGVFECYKLKDLYLPNLKEACTYAFGSARTLSSAIVGSNDLSVRTRAFENCWALQSINLNSAVRLATAALTGCTSLTSVCLADVLSVQYQAFDGDNKLALIDMSARTDTSMPYVEGATSSTTCAWKSGIVVKLPSAVKDAWQAKVDNPTGLTVSEQFWVNAITAGTLVLEEAT